MATIKTNYQTPKGLDHDLEQTCDSAFSVTSRMAWLERQVKKRRSRKALLELSDDLLRDIGRSRFEASREARRRFAD
ncbi:DUF1127 domain-containing protein [Mesorhizobium sp. STM 4661]|uniref:DUF1127 domain-containing protein n=1 Tax=Mesorhizobium sp. STM 4661 TaxID=1297570 RepID=UPI0002BFD3E5|nr:DUF1127 domain-containing protein [Mesorhizobium sp. STM 4661]CCV15523.1 hypothetical protein MESS4_790086 [Mesorhizobium sp. STM 4661]